MELLRRIVQTGCRQNCWSRQALKRIFSRTAIRPLSDVGLREGSLAPRIHGQWTLSVDRALASLKTLIQYK